MLTIGLLSDKYPPDPGGLAASTQRLAHGLVQAGHTVHVSVISDRVAPGAAQTAIESDKLLIHRIGRQKRTDDTLMHWFDTMCQWHHTSPFDILHGYYLVEAGFVTVYTARYLGLPSIVSARGNDLDRSVFDPKRAAPILWALSHASIVTTVSTDMAAKARALAPQQRVEPVFNAVDTDLFAPAPLDPALVAEFGLDGRPVIGFVGEARRKKGLIVMLRAFANLTDTLDVTPKFLLVGDVRKDDKDILNVFRAKHPHVPLKVIPYMEQAKLPAYYNLLDVLVLPSLADGLPNALLEGAACSRAMIASKVGGIPDVIQDGINGLLIPANDSKALTQALNLLIADPDRRQRLGQTARNTVLQDFTPHREISTNVGLYQMLLK